MPALRADGSIEELGDGQQVAMVAEVTDLVDLSAWPHRTRLIVRKARGDIIRILEG